MNKECQIVQDLIPLVNDGIASEESEKFVYKHCQECEECRCLLNDLPQCDDSALHSKWHKKVRFTLWGFVILMTLLACSFSQNEHIFQNFLLIPMIGGLGYILLKKRIYVLYVLIMAVQVLMNVFQQRLMGSMVFIIVSYWIFMSVGVVIAFCYEYAFTGRKK